MLWEWKCHVRVLGVVVVARRRDRDGFGGGGIPGSAWGCWERSSKL